MTFGEQIDAYLTMLQCSAKELSSASGLSCAAISRYRANKRVPEAGSRQLSMLVTGIIAVAARKSIQLSEASVKAALIASIGPQHGLSIAQNLNMLISTADISINELSHSLNFDASYLSRIRSGQRRPADIPSFADGVCRFVVRRFTGEKRAVIAKLIGKDVSLLGTDSEYLRLLREWLLSSPEKAHDYMAEFLKKLDEFDLNQYIRAIHFQDLKVASVPFQLPTVKIYYGLNEMKQGELDFLKSTVLFKSTDSVFMCNDMPMEDVAQDIDFGKKWMFAIAMILRKGLHLDIIHNVERPFNELMLGLESWIPIYMTGQVSPYYLKGVKNSVYCHFNYVSGAAALTGECINGFHANGRYYLTKNHDEIAYYRKKSENLLSKALPLMDIYRAANSAAYGVFLASDAATHGNRRRFLSSLPLFTLPDAILNGILSRSNLSSECKKQIIDYHSKQKLQTEALLAECRITDEVALLTEEEISKHPVSIELSDIFSETELYYTFEEYSAHLFATQAYAAGNPNYILKLNGEQPFRNIKISVAEGRYAVVSKSKSPVIHFVIRHPKMLNALEKFIAPVSELKSPEKAQADVD